MIWTWTSLGDHYSTYHQPLTNFWTSFTEQFPSLHYSVLHIIAALISPKSVPCFPYSFDIVSLQIFPMDNSISRPPPPQKVMSLLHPMRRGHLILRMLLFVDVSQPRTIHENSCSKNQWAEKHYHMCLKGVGTTSNCYCFSVQFWGKRQDILLTVFSYVLSKIFNCVFYPWK